MSIPSEIRPVRTAVIGCGAISGIYLENISRRFRILELAGVCDLNREAAEAASRKHGVPVLTMEQILADPGIEMVINLTTPGAHYSVIRTLLEGGKHVYTEKVLCPDFGQAKEVVRLADEKGLTLCAAPDTFLGAAFQTARFAVDSGLIGEPTSCVAVLQRDAWNLAEKFPFTTRPGGGIGIDVAIYYVTQLVNLLGPASRVCGVSHTYRPERFHYFTSKPDFGKPYTLESETLLAAAVEFCSGAAGSLHFNSASIRLEKPYVTVFGTDGILTLANPDAFGGDVLFTAKGQTDPVVLPPTHAYDGNERGLGAADMAWALRTGRTPRAHKEQALHALEILTGAVESGKTGVYHKMETTFTRQPALPRGYLDEDYGKAEPEAALSIY